MPSDIIRIGSKTYTRTRAQALGFLDEDGNVRDSVPRDSAAAKIIERDRRRAEWAKQQGLPAPRIAGGTVEPELTEDGQLKVTAAPEPLRPQNVSADGTPVTDEETLAAIAERTAQIEAAREGAAASAPVDDAIQDVVGEGGVTFGFGEAEEVTEPKPKRRSRA